jgi:hypothetical protein
MDLTRAGAFPTIEDARYSDEDVYVYRITELEADAQAFIKLAGLVNCCLGLCAASGEQLVKRRNELYQHDRLSGLLGQSPSADQ